MRHARTVLLLCGIALLICPAIGDAQFATQKKKSKNYYIVRKGDQCTIQTGQFGEKPEGAVGDAPYATKNYAKSAIEKLPECKGTKVEPNEKHKKGDL